MDTSTTNETAIWIAVDSLKTRSSLLPPTGEVELSVPHKLSLRC